MKPKKKFNILNDIVWWFKKLDAVNLQVQEKQECWNSKCENGPKV
jgi:hypothetical protein